MAQPKIEGVGHGIPRMFYASDGTDWIAVLVDALGHIQADILSSTLPTDAATDTVLQAIRDRIGALTSPAAGSTNKLLTDALTALQLIDDLRAALGSVDTDDLQVDVKTLPLPTDAAKETKQDTMITALQLIDDLRAALDSVGTDEIDVNVEAYDPVPSSPVNAFNTSVLLPTATNTDIISHTVTAGKTFYLTDIIVSDVGFTAGVESLVKVKVDAVTKMEFHVSAGNMGHIPLRTPIKATSGLVVLLQGYQWSGADKWFSGNLIGFEV